MKIAGPLLAALVALAVAAVAWLVLWSLSPGGRDPAPTISPVTAPIYADCSGESPVDPCVISSTDLGARSHDTPP